MKYTEQLNIEFLLTARELFENFYRSGKYPLLSQTEKKLKIVKSSMKKELESGEIKKYEYPEINVVAKFVSRGVYEVDQSALNEYLHDIGLFIPTVKLDYQKLKKAGMLEKVEGFVKYIPRFVVPSLNKKGKLPDLNFHVNGFGVEQMARNFSYLNRIYKSVEVQYELIKQKMEKCPELIWYTERKKKDKKLVYRNEYGSLRLKNNDPIYDIDSTVDHFGLDWLLAYGRLKNRIVDRFIQKGTITKKDLDKFKRLVDIQLSFVVMPLDIEQQSMEFLHEKRMIAAQNNRI
ncbi:hypothetical protein [Bacillus sp. SM2101]|uniref:hypothetical protein n=1 Tax=Bacillus sp. SM2101 TaxID=2805366 RepID=UPI001BDF1516|nr:hypothetical protein [Bacillus sp. SM2101]